MRRIALKPLLCYNFFMENIDNLAPNTLAFVGDAVFTLFIREHLAKSNLRPCDLSKKAGWAVSAVSQSDILKKIEDILLDQEKDIVRRCRNANKTCKAKNASATQYRLATGLEGLIGYLYLTKSDRLTIILQQCLKFVEL